jgi:hypothetical protein
MTAAVASSKCGIATNAAAALGGIFCDFRLSQHHDKNSQCAACAPACGQWQYTDIDAVLSYSGLCNLAPEQFILDLGSDGLAAGVTGVMPDGGSTQPCNGCTGLSGEYALEFCPWDASGADHDPPPWANGQCYPAHPVPPSYYGAASAPGGQCKWCYYGATALCDNDAMFQAGLGIFPATLPGGGTGYQFQVDCWINSLPIPDTSGDTVYPWQLWHAWYQSGVFDPAIYPNCTDPIGSGLTLDLAGFQGVPNLFYENLWFGGQICGNPWSSVTIR